MDLAGGYCSHEGTLCSSRITIFFTYYISLHTIGPPRGQIVWRGGTIVGESGLPPSNIGANIPYGVVSGGNRGPKTACRGLAKRRKNQLHLGTGNEEEGLRQLEGRKCG